MGVWGRSPQEFRQPLVDSPPPVNFPILFTESARTKSEPNRGGLVEGQIDSRLVKATENLPPRFTDDSTCSTKLLMSQSYKIRHAKLHNHTYALKNGQLGPVGPQNGAPKEPKQ